MGLLVVARIPHCVTSGLTACAQKPSFHQDVLDRPTYVNRLVDSHSCLHRVRFAFVYVAATVTVLRQFKLVDGSNVFVGGFQS